MHVLVATDGSDVALDAARQGMALVAAPERITLLSVIGNLPADTGGGIEGPVYTPEQEEELRLSETRHAQQSIEETAASLPPRAPTEKRVETGDPATVICAVAAEIGADVIVLGSHGKGFLSRVVLGSVSEYVTRHAPCPVLVVRHRHDS